MDTLYVLLMGFISIVIINNLVFTKFLGICPYLGVSGRIDMAFGMGLAVTFVVTMSGTLTWMIDNWVLIPIGLGVTRYVCFILVIAGAVQLVEMYVRKFFPSLYESFGIFLPLIVVNFIVLGRAEAFASKRSVPHSIADALGITIGFMLALLIISFIRQLLGTGALTIFNNQLFALPGLVDHPMAIFIKPPGAFLVIALLMALFRYKGVIE